MQQQTDYLKLTCQEHNEEIIFVLKQEFGKSKSNCLKCLLTNQLQNDQLSQPQRDLIRNAIKRLTQKQHQSEMRLEYLKNIYSIIKDKFNIEIDSVLQVIDSQQYKIDKSINEKIEQFLQSIPQIIFHETQTQQLSEKMLEVEVFYKLNSEFDEQIKKKSIESYEQLLQSLDKVIEQIQVWNERDQKPKLIPFQSENQCQKVESKQNFGYFSMIAEREEMSDCFTIAMNKDEKILACGENRIIKLYSYDKNGQIHIKQKLYGHTGSVIGICFSNKDNNWFISCAQDNTLRVWKEEQNGQWISLQILEKKEFYANDMVLNNEDDELITCEEENLINIWFKMADTSLWYWKESLYLPTGYINHLSLNPDSTLLASVGYDKLRIWEKGNDSRWKQKQVIDDPTNDRFINVQFINSSELIATTVKQGNCYILKTDSLNLFQVYQKLLLDDSAAEQIQGFPIVYNNKQEMVICRHNFNNNMILKKNLNGEFVVHQILKGKYLSRYLTHDGRYLILGNYANHNLEIWCQND